MSRPHEDSEPTVANIYKHPPYQDNAETASTYPLHSDVLPEAALSPPNRQALALHEAWYAEPDDLGQEWWAEFEEELRQNRLNFRVIDV